MGTRYSGLARITSVLGGLTLACGNNALGQDANNGPFVDRTLPDSCYAIRRTERTGFDKYYTGESTTSPAEKSGAEPVHYPWDGGAFSREEVYSDLVSNRVADILCIGDVVAILTPIYSNGGDVVIFANRIDVQATIDTRRYYDIANRARYYRGKGFSQNYNDFFASYHRNNPDGMTVGSRTLAPEFPGGGSITYNAAPGSTTSYSPEGSPPPVLGDTDRLLGKSGSITIFTKEIQISEKLRHGIPVPSDLCVTDPAPKPFAFQAGGLRGGKGGLGSPPSCPGVHPPGGFSCDPALYVNSGLSGPPGNGGDGSNVSVFRLGGEFSVAEQAVLRAASNVQGGAPGTAAIYRTIDAPETASGISTNICDRKPVGVHPAASAGSSGQFQVGSSSVLAGLERIEAFTETSDANPAVDMKDLIQRARLNRNVEHRGLGEFLRSRLSRTALAAERMWAEQLALEIEKKPMKARASIEPFGGIRLDLSKSASPALSPNISGLVSRIAQLDIPVSTNPVASYFASKGGAFSITDPDATSSMNGKLIGEDLAGMAEANTEQLELLNKLETQVSESLYTTQAGKIQEELARIQQRIAEINAIPDKTGADFPAIAAAIQRAAPAISAFVGAVVAQNYIQAEQNYSAAIAGIKDIQEIVFGKLTNAGAKAGLADLRAKFDELNLHLRILSEIFLQEKNELLEAQHYYAAKELADRHRLVSRLDGRLPLGEDLIKHSFVAYFLDPSRNKNYLIENLSETAVFLGGRTEYYSMLRLPPVTNMCQLNSSGSKNYAACLRLPPSKQFRVVEVSVDTIKFPAWIVAPNREDTVWPTFNSSVKIFNRKTRPEALKLFQQ